MRCAFEICFAAVVMVFGGVSLLTNQKLYRFLVKPRFELVGFPAFQSRLLVCGALPETAECLDDFETISYNCFESDIWQSEDAPLCWNNPANCHDVFLFEFSSACCHSQKLFRVILKVGVTSQRYWLIPQSPIYSVFFHHDTWGIDSVFIVDLSPIIHDLTPFLSVC